LEEEKEELAVDEEEIETAEEAQYPCDVHGKCHPKNELPEPSASSKLLFRGT